MTSDPDEYRRHMQLVDRHVELRARSAAKMQLVAQGFSGLLQSRGWTKPIAAFAGQIALACFWTGREAGGDPSCLADDARAAFELALTLGRP